MCGGHGRGMRSWDWPSAVPGAVGPSVEGRSYRGVLRSPRGGAPWWRCTGHKPHASYEEAAACAAAEKTARQQEVSVP